jgi:hypothetical protein
VCNLEFSIDNQGSERRNNNRAFWKSLGSWGAGWDHMSPVLGILFCSRQQDIAKLHSGAWWPLPISSHLLAYFNSNPCFLAFLCRWWSQIYLASHHVRATPLVLSMWPCKLKLDEEKSKHASLAYQNGFGPTFLPNFLRLVKVTTKPNTCQRRV